MNNGSNDDRFGLHVPPVGGISPVRRIERKRKKLREGDGVWRDVLSETLGSEHIVPPARVEDSREPSEVETPEQVEPALPELPTRRDFDGSEHEFKRMIDEIRKMSDDPEGLMESHLSIFTDPAPPGKLLNSQG